MAIINTLYNTNPYQDKIMGGLEGDPLTNISNEFARSGTGIDQGFINQYNLGQRYDPMFDNQEFKEIPGFNFKDAPTSLMSQIQNPKFLNNPRKGIIDNFLMKKGNPGNTIVDKAKSGIGKGFDFGKSALSGILSLITGVPFLGNILTGIGSNFEDRQISGDGTIVDEFGRSYTADELNKQNALGGYYTDAARSSRRRTADIAKMLERQKNKGLTDFGRKRLEKLQAQEAAQEAARERATKSMAAANKAAGTGGYQAGYGGDFMDGPSGAGRGNAPSDKGGSDSMGSFKNGGLAGLL